MADGSLRGSTEAESVVPRRFGILCGRDVVEARHLHRELEALRSVRNAIAHGRRPTRSEIQAFLGEPPDANTGADAAPWLPHSLDPLGRLVADRAMGIIRSIYRTWLFATIEIIDGVPSPKWSRTDLLRLVQEAQSKVPGAHERLAAILAHLDAPGPATRRDLSL